MAPKEKKKKKTKEELEEERRLAEEQARLAEEERLRQEEEERKRLAEIEAERQRLLSILLDTEAERVQAERAEQEPLVSQYDLERHQAYDRRKEVAEWERFVSCINVPKPQDRARVAGFFSILAETPAESLEETFKTCMECRQLLEECASVRLDLLQEGKPEEAAVHCKDQADLHAGINTQIDNITAHILHRSDEHANEKNEVQLSFQRGPYMWGIWLNTSKNPRLKNIDFSPLAIHIEIPKPIALASIALRIQQRPDDEFYDVCTNEFMAVGDILVSDLLVLPPSCKKIKTWTIRQVTPLTSHIQKVPYPIPPAGADPLTYKSEEEPPPLGFTYTLPTPPVFLDSPPVTGWWDTETKSWRRDGITTTAFDPATCTLSCQSTHVAPTAAIVSRVRLLPYKSWSIRPTGGKDGNTAAITLQVGLNVPVVLEAGPGWARLLSPQWPQLSSLAGQQLQPLHLLYRLTRLGMPLLPEDRDAKFAGVVLKEREVEESFCKDLAHICGVCLVASSRWNQRAAAPDEVLIRISEVTDWEGGGRTELQHVERVFSKEKEDGPRAVRAIIRRGNRGVAWCQALDKHENYPQLPGHETVESVQACIDSVYGQVHVNLLALMKGPDAEDPANACLRLTREGLEQIRTTDALFTESLSQLLFGLRVCSFC